MYLFSKTIVDALRIFTYIFLIGEVAKETEVYKEIPGCNTLLKSNIVWPLL